jgi:DNA helicase-2/ATP-dependent DNA helicase PcrA
MAVNYADLAEFLSDLALEPPDGSVAAVESADRDDEQLVLSTIHSAKGLEWQCVFVIWALDGKFPSMHSFGTDEGLEEERRLFYVAVTRAKRHLYVTYPINVFDKSSGMLLAKPTRFLDHIPSEYMEALALVEEGRSYEGRFHDGWDIDHDRYA